MQIHCCPNQSYGCLVLVSHPKKGWDCHMDGSVSETSVVCQVLQYREMLCGVVWVIYSFLPDS